MTPETPGVFRLEGLQEAVSNLGTGDTVNDAEMKTPDPEEEEVLLKTPPKEESAPTRAGTAEPIRLPIRPSLPLRLGLTLNARAAADIQVLQPTLSLPRSSLEMASSVTVPWTACAQLAASLAKEWDKPSSLVITEVTEVRDCKLVAPGKYRIPKLSKKPIEAPPPKVRSSKAETAKESEAPAAKHQDVQATGETPNTSRPTKGAPKPQPAQAYISQRMRDHPGGGMSSAKFCFNCRVGAHHYSVCPEPAALFCMRCGEQGTTLSRCRRCKRR